MKYNEKRGDDMKKIIMIGISICVMVVLTSCQKTAHLKQDEIILYRFAEYDFNFLGQEDYQDVMEKKDDEQDVKLAATYAQESYLKEGYFFIKATNEQAQALYLQNQDLIRQVNNQLKQMDKHYQMEVRDDYSSLTIHISQQPFQNVFSKTSFQYADHLLQLMNMVLANRILTTQDSDNIVEVHVINATSGYQVAQALFPYENLQVTSQDWENSRSQDVMTSSKNEGYQRILMQIIESNDHRILFQPLQQDVYPDDQLCLCLESIYAQDIYLPYQLKSGDQVYLTLNGQYALHDDGDEITDIAPLSVIPSRYVHQP